MGKYQMLISVILSPVGRESEPEFITPAIFYPAGRELTKMMVCEEGQGVVV